MDVRDWWVLHFTHVDNLPAIAAATFLSCDNDVQAGTKTQVGDVAIKENRRWRNVPVGPGGTVADYVPFYFAPRSPMMYRIMCDRRDSVAGRYQGGDRPLVYLAVKIGALVDAGTAWVGTDGNAASQITKFTTDIDILASMIDWPLMKAKMWNDTSEDSDRQRRRMAELLVHRKLPLALIHELATYSGEYARSARDAMHGLPFAGRVTVRPAWYYGDDRR